MNNEGRDKAIEKLELRIKALEENSKISHVENVVKEIEKPKIGSEPEEIKTIRRPGKKTK